MTRQPTDNEINRAIAEFVKHRNCYTCKNLYEEGGPLLHHMSYNCDHVDFWDNEPCDKFDANSYPKFTESLDRLVSVWEKLGIVSDYEFNTPKDGIDWHFRVQPSRKNAYFSAHGKTIQKAAALATYYAIQELKGN